jgi:hypothetical protein
MSLSKKFLFLFSGVLPFCVLSQNEFYIKGNNDITTTEVFVKNTTGIAPTLFVKGEIFNNQGVFINQLGEVEITGDWTNIANGLDAYYQSNGIERFSGDADSRISGSFDGVSGDINQFYNLKISKDNALNYVELAANVHVNELGSLDYENNGVIRTDVSSHGNNGQNYSYYIFLQNSNPASLINHSLTPASDNKFIEGRLRWRTNGSLAYGFPIGGSNNGVEPFGISLTAADNLVLEGHIIPQAQISGLLSNGVVYHDVGTPITPGSTIASDGCSAGADGILDKIDLTVHSGIGWRAFPVSGTFTDYSIAFKPAPVNHIVPFNPSGVDADCENVELLYVSKDLIPGALATNLIAGTPDWPSTSGYNVTPQTSTTIAGVTGFHLSGITSFSDFGLHTTAMNGAGVALPVELIFLQANGIENKYILVEWKTATEINNEGFQIERSTDGINFTYIGFVNGAGNSSQMLGYSFEDHEAQQGVIYYYRLKQIDFDNNSEYSKIVSASIHGTNLLNMSVYPNPSQNGGSSTVRVVVAESLDVLVAVSDIAGRNVAKYNLQLKSGVNEFELNAAFMPSGTYVISITAKEFSANQKWVLLK